jgi:hypothetical protein
VEFVRTAIEAGADGARRSPSEPNGAVVDSYRITPRRTVSPGAMQDRGRRRGPPQDGIVKPAMSDTVRGAMYADNWFAMWINGRLVAVDSIDFLPHNVVSVDLLPEHPPDRIDPKQPFFEHDFAGAKWIWTSDLDLDNTVLLRTRIEKPGWTPRWTTKPDLDASVR